MGATVKSDSAGEARSCGVVASTPMCVLVLLVVQLVASSSSHTARLTFGTTFGTNVQNVQLNRTQTPPPPQVLGEPNGPRSARLTTFGVTNPKPQNNSNSRPAGKMGYIVNVKFKLTLLTLATLHVTPPLLEECGGSVNTRLVGVGRRSLDTPVQYMELAGPDTSRHMQKLLAEQPRPVTQERYTSKLSTVGRKPPAIPHNNTHTPPAPAVSKYPKYTPITLTLAVYSMTPNCTVLPAKASRVNGAYLRKESY
ncbi:unnamed protein product, partial [Timema podura]|nr:unnamed protein product [Timema podura]